MRSPVPPLSLASGSGEGTRAAASRSWAGNRNVGPASALAVRVTHSGPRGLASLPQPPMGEAAPSGMLAAITPTQTARKPTKKPRGLRGLFLVAQCQLSTPLAAAGLPGVAARSGTRIAL